MSVRPQPLHPAALAVPQDLTVTCRRVYIDGFVDGDLDANSLGRNFVYLSKGSFALVYQATQRLHDGQSRRVAVKLLKPEHHTRPDARQLTRFLHEASLQGQLHHKNIVRVYGVCALPLSVLLPVTPSHGLDAATHSGSCTPITASMEGGGGGCAGGLGSSAGGPETPSPSATAVSPFGTSLSVSTQQQQHRRQQQQQAPVFAAAGAFATTLPSSPSPSPLLQASMPGASAGTDTRCLAIVQEFMQGGNLYDVLSGGRGYSMKAALQWLLDIAMGMRHCHSRRPLLVHRDLKPENILLGWQAGRDTPVAKITDFGLVSAICDDGTRLPMPSLLRLPPPAPPPTPLAHLPSSSPSHMTPFLRSLSTRSTGGAAGSGSSGGGGRRRTTSFDYRDANGALSPRSPAIGINESSGHHEQLQDMQQQRTSPRTSPNSPTSPLLAVSRLANDSPLRGGSHHQLGPSRLQVGAGGTVVPAKQQQQQQQQQLQPDHLRRVSEPLAVHQQLRLASAAAATAGSGGSGSASRLPKGAGPRGGGGGGPLIVARWSNTSAASSPLPSPPASPLPHGRKRSDDVVPSAPLPPPLEPHHASSGAADMKPGCDASIGQADAEMRPSRDASSGQVDATLMHKAEDRAVSRLSTSTSSPSPEGPRLAATCPTSGTRDNASCPTSGIPNHASCPTSATTDSTSCPTTVTSQAASTPVHRMPASKSEDERPSTVPAPAGRRRRLPPTRLPRFHSWDGTDFERHIWRSAHFSDGRRAPGGTRWQQQQQQQQRRKLGTVCAASFRHSHSGVAQRAPPPGVCEMTRVAQSGAAVADDSLDMFQMRWDLTGRCGSIMYMSPEVAHGQPYNERTDVFSFGVIMFELLSRKALSAGFAASDTDAALEHLHKMAWQGWRPALPPAWPRQLRLLIMLCWHKEPRMRPSFATIVSRLQAAQFAGCAAQMDAHHAAANTAAVAAGGTLPQQLPPKSAGLQPAVAAPIPVSSAKHNHVHAAGPGGAIAAAATGAQRKVAAVPQKSSGGLLDGLKIFKAWGKYKPEQDAKPRA